METGIRRRTFLSVGHLARSKQWRQLPRASGEIGRHAGFRFLCLRAWGFKSPLAHTDTEIPGQQARDLCHLTAPRQGVLLGFPPRLATKLNNSWRSTHPVPCSGRIPIETPAKGRCPTVGKGHAAGTTPAAGKKSAETKKQGEPKCSHSSAHPSPSQALQLQPC